MTESDRSTSAIESDSHLDDEGYQGSFEASLLSSMASDVRSGVLENGRLYGKFGQHGLIHLNDCDAGTNSN
jgi:hypothetical protein